MSRFGKFLTQIMAQDRLSHAHEVKANINDVDTSYDSFEPYALGTYTTKETQKRDRKSIYTRWQQMLRDPTIAAAVNLHVTAALGGHESRGDVIFITPADRVRKRTIRSRELRKMIEKEALILAPMLNEIAFTLCRNAVGMGDGFLRVYGIKGVGITKLLCNEYTESQNIQAYEQGGRTVGYHVLEYDEYEVRPVAKLNNVQMVRMKMARYGTVPQFRLKRWMRESNMAENNIDNLPIIPSQVGGSILFDAESAWEQVQLILSALTSQQIADSVKQAFLTIDVSNMPPEQQTKYKAGLIKTLQKHSDKVKEAFTGGDAIYATQYHALPVWGDKQVLSPMGDISQRNAPLNTELLMTHVRRMTGALGMDMSLLGWADMLAGGLGDGAAFHTSAQVMQKSVHIRQAFTKAATQIVNIHLGYKYGETFAEHDLPFKFEFYSDMSAASTEALNNRQTRANMLAMYGAAIAQLKDLNLSREANQLLLTDIAGMDDHEADLIADAIDGAKAQDAQEGKDQIGADDADPADDEQDHLADDEE